MVKIIIIHLLELLLYILGRNYSVSHVGHVYGTMSYDQSIILTKHSSARAPNVLEVCSSKEE